jgi:hypothetical protein
LPASDDLWQLFAAAPVPTQDASDALMLCGVPLPHVENGWVAKDATGAAAMLIRIAEPPSRPRPPAISLQHLTVRHDVDCRVYHPDGSVDNGCYSVIRCVSADLALNRYFVRVCSNLLALFEPTPSADDLSAGISRLAELFRLLGERGNTSVQGLWAELFLIARARAPVALLSAWHAEFTDVYDFNSGSCRIEVKSCQGASRSHHFSLDQLSPPAGCRAIVASIFVQRTGGGQSVGDLADAIRSRIGRAPQLSLRLDEVIASSLGDALQATSDFRYDVEVASRSLRFYDARDVPSVNRELPPQVTDVHFVSHLAGCREIEFPELRLLGELATAIVPV